VKKASTATALDEALRGSTLPSPVWVATDEPLLMVEHGDRIRARARELGHVERVVIDIATGFDASRLIGQGQSQSLFGERRLLDLRLAAKPPRGFGEALADLADVTGTDTVVMLSSVRLDKAQVGAAWFTRAMARGLLVEGYGPDRAEFGRWIAQRLGANGQRADSATLELIAERTEGNLLAARQAIDRLALLAPAGHLDAATVDEVVSNDARFDGFALVETALAGRIGRALTMLDGLKAQDAPLPLLGWALADAIRRLLKAIEAREAGQPVPSALRSAGIFGRREAAYRQAMGRLDAASALECLRAVARLDRMAKGVDSSALGADPWSMVERILIAMAGGRPLAETSTRSLHPPRMP